MKPPLKVSLIISVADAETSINECLDCAFKSSHPFFEIIIINTADSFGESFPGARIIHEEKKGLVNSHHRGFLEAKGDVLAFVDAGSYVSKEWSQKIFDEFSHNEKLVCLSGPSLHQKVPSWKQFLTRLYHYVCIVPIYTVVGYMIDGDNFAIRKSSLVNMGGFDTTIDFHREDADIARRASELGKVKFDMTFVVKKLDYVSKKHGAAKSKLLYGASYISQVITHRSIRKNRQMVSGSTLNKY